MGLFGNHSKPDDPSLVERVETLERALKNLRLEWEETYDKLNHAVKRLQKRERDAPGIEPPTEPGTDPLKDLDPISQAIWARRRRVSAPGPVR